MGKRPLLTVLLVLTSIATLAAVVPGPPLNLTEHVTGDIVTLFWQDPATGGATGYVVEAALSPAGPPITAVPTTDPTIVIRDVPAGIYYIRVRAKNDDGAGQPSNEVQVMVPGGSGGCSARPPAPTNLAGSVSGNLVLLSWSASTGGCAASSYTVRAGSATGISDVAVVNAGAVTALTAAAPRGTYYVRVVASNIFGASQASDEIVLTVGTPCQPPSSGPLLLQPTVKGNVVDINWVAQSGDISGYIVEAGSTSGATDLLNLMVTGTSFTGSSGPVVAYVRVRSVNACGTGPASNEFVVTVPAQQP